MPSSSSALSQRVGPMTEDELISKIKGRFGYLYHFTPNQNIDLVKKHGLLSRKEMAAKGITCPRFGGNDWSRDADDARGLNDYVHLGFFSSHHPMEYLLQKSGVTCTYIAISPDVIRLSGVLYSAEVANKAGSVVAPLATVAPKFDMEILFTRLDWRLDAIKARLAAAKKYEVLVPKQIALNYIKI